MKIGKASRVTAESVFEKPIETRILGIEEVELQSKDGKKKFKQLQIETEDGILTDWDCYPCEVSVGDTVRLENPNKKGKITVTSIQRV